jgi:hypothetical protein
MGLNLGESTAFYVRFPRFLFETSDLDGIESRTYIPSIDSNESRIAKVNYLVAHQKTHTTQTRKPASTMRILP